MQRNTLRKIVDNAEIIRTFFFLAFIQVVSLFPRRRRQERKKKVLVIRLDAIGDFILWLDCARELRNLYPPDQYQITLLATKTWTALAAGLPYFDEVWPFKRLRYVRNPAYSCKMIWNIYKADFDIAIQPAHSREIQLGDILMKATFSAERIGAEGDFFNQRKWLKRISDRWYTRLIPEQEKLSMELQRNAHFIRELGAKNFRAGVPRFPVIGKVPNNFSLKDYYVVFPGAGATLRQWPARKFTKLCDKLYQVTGWAGVICGGPGEDRLGQAIAAQTAIPLENWAGRTSLTDLIAIIAHAKIVIANETSAVHIGAAVSTPSVSILGGGHFGRFLPYQVETGTINTLPCAVWYPMECFNCNWRCIHPLDPDGAAVCIGRVSVDAAWEKVNELLSRLVCRTIKDIRSTT